MLDLFPLIDNLAALMGLVRAVLSESQRGALVNLIFERGRDLTALTLEQLSLVPCSKVLTREPKLFS